jgi:uncharacterized protein
MDDSLQALLASADQLAFGRVKADLATECHACPWLVHCRGGCPRERRCNPERHDLSLLCHAYRCFFAHIDGRMHDLADSWRRRHSALGQREVDVSAEAAP